MRDLHYNKRGLTLQLVRPLHLPLARDRRAADPFTDLL